MPKAFVFCRYNFSMDSNPVSYAQHYHIKQSKFIFENQKICLKSANLSLILLFFLIKGRVFVTCLFETYSQ